MLLEIVGGVEKNTGVPATAGCAFFIRDDTKLNSNNLTDRILAPPRRRVNFRLALLSAAADLARRRISTNRKKEKG
ncbi:MAG TPA: hypothetical protein DCM10_15225 [Xanthomarina gelatinilytica]|nr:hypothetical protein [Xanthomarina gelatinilytica]